MIVEHPEFFRLNSSEDKASLVIRRQHQRVYDIDAARNLNRNEVDKLSDEQKRRISRSPLGSEEISTLIATAIELHARAIEESKNRRWWLPVLTAIIAATAAIAGTIIGALLSASSSG